MSKEAGVKRSRQEREVDTPYKAENTDSDAGSSDLDISTAMGKDLIVSVTEARTTASGTEIALLNISTARPDTHLGKVQGDHVTAYRSFLEMLMIAAEGRTIRKAPQQIVSVAKALLPGKSEELDAILRDLDEEMTRVVSRDRRHSMLEDLRAAEKYTEDELLCADKALKDARRHMFMRMVERVGQYFITQVNLEEDTAFRKEGRSDTGEGLRVKRAIYCLKLINDLEKICRHGEDGDPDVKRMDAFYKKYIKTGAKFKIGANVCFGEGVVANLDKLWKGSIKDMPDSQKAFLFRLYRGFDKEQKIGECFGDLFDFRNDSHERLIARDILYKVVAKHLVTMFNAFDEFKSYDEPTRTRIVDYFLSNTVLEAQGWKDLKAQRGRMGKVSLDILSLKEGVSRFARLDEFRMLSETERALSKSVVVREMGKAGKEEVGGAIIRAIDASDVRMGVGTATPSATPQSSRTGGIVR